MKVSLAILENVAAEIAQDSPRASARRVQVLAIIARSEPITMRDICERVSGSPDDSAAHQHITALIRMGWVERLGLEPVAEGKPGELVGLSAAGARKLGLED